MVIWLKVKLGNTRDDADEAQEDSSNCQQRDQGCDPRLFDDSGRQSMSPMRLAHHVSSRVVGARQWREDNVLSHDALSLNRCCSRASAAADHAKCFCFCVTDAGVAWTTATAETRVTREVNSRRRMSACTL